MTMKEKLVKIASHYGYESQKQKLIEEMAELTVGVCKDNKENIIEEMSDVEVMLDQMKILLDCEGAVFLEKMHKVDRQIERMKNDGVSL